MIEALERLSRRPESRMDVQRMLDKLSEPAKMYARHLVTSGPSGDAAAAKALEMTKAELELAANELENAIKSIRS